MQDDPAPILAGSFEVCGGQNTSAVSLTTQLGLQTLHCKHQSPQHAGLHPLSWEEIISSSQLAQQYLERELIFQEVRQDASVGSLLCIFSRSDTLCCPQVYRKKEAISATKQV